MRPTTRSGLNISRGAISTTHQWWRYGYGFRQSSSASTSSVCGRLARWRLPREQESIYLISWHLFGDRKAAIFAALLYCAMLLVSAGAIIITPDTPLLFFWSIALYALVRIYEDGDLGWWWVVGFAMGLGLQSKYTALLLGAGIACAMALAVPSLRHRWRCPTPYLSGALSLAIFAPVIAWNYQHEWASFALQFGRAEVSGLQPAIYI